MKLTHEEKRLRRLRATLSGEVMARVNPTTYTVLTDIDTRITTK